MFKKLQKILPLLFVSTLAVAVDNNPTYYVGGQVGYSHLTADLKLTGTSLADTGSAKTTLKKGGFTGAIFAGVTYDAKGFFLSGELFLEKDMVQGKKSGINLLNAAGNEVFDDVAVRLTKRFTTGLFAVIGKRFGKYSFYIKGGPLLGAFKYEHLDDNDKDSAKKRVFGGALAVGTEIAITNSVFMRLEYMYQQFKSFKTRDLDPDDVQKSFAKVKLCYNIITVGLAYRF